MTKTTSLLLFVVVLSFGSWLLWRSPGSSDRILPKNSEESEQPAVGVLVAEVRFSENSVRFEALGTGRARNSIDIYPAVAEEVRQIHFVAGQRVREGDLLVQLDDRAETLALELAEVELKEANSLLARYDRAVKDGAVPESEVDSARSAVESAKVALSQAKLNLQERKILAPFDGLVGLPRVDPGERVTSATLITGLDNRRSILVDFRVPEMFIGTLAQGQQITSSTPAYPERQFSGTVSALESRVDTTSRTILTRAEIDNSEDLLRPGMSFSLVLEISGSRYATVPEIALQWSNDGPFLWIIREEKAVRVPIAIISRSAGQVLVEAEVEEGEYVVVEGLQRLQQGSRVRTLGVITGVTANKSLATPPAPKSISSPSSGTAVDETTRGAGVVSKKPKDTKKNLTQPSDSKSTNPQSVQGSSQ